jgi:general secretion pathway protein B
MSSILKALKKLEQEKELRGRGSFDIARGISRDLPRSSAKPRWVIPLAVASAAVAASLATFTLISFFPPEPLKPASATGQHEESRPSVVKVPGRSLSPAAGSGVSPGKVDRPADVALQRGFTGGKPVYVTPPADEIGPVQLSKPSTDLPIPLLHLTGIAWQKDSSDRVAVVNGISVTEGVMVEGARVEEIFQDRVRFSFEKQTFDVVLGRANRAK